MKIVEQAALYSKDVLNKLSKNYTFHNILHTYEVVEASMIIAKHCNLNPVDSELVLISCWFHDTGFSISPFNHEEYSASIAKQFLTLKRYRPKKITKIIGCIRATRLPQEPSNLIESIVCDADMFHLSTNEYWVKNQSLKNEREHISNAAIRNDQWCYEILNFLSQHQYHTEYGRKILSKNKQAHLIQNVRKLEALKVS